MTRLYSGRLSIFQSCAIDDSRLGAAAFRVLACLGTYSDEQGWCRPSQTTMGKRLGISRQAVQKQIKTLEELGYLEIRHRFSDKDRRQLASWYRLILDYQLPDEHRREPLPPDDDDETPPQPDVAPPATSQVAPGATPRVAPPATSKVARTTHINDSKNDKKKPPPRKDITEMTLAERLAYDAELTRKLEQGRTYRGVL